MDDEDKKIKTFFKYYIVAFLLTLGLVGWWRFAPKPLPILGRIPTFRFQAEDGRFFDSQQLAGKVWVADFFYCSCHTTCPLQTAFMSELDKKWRGDPDLDLVSFTLDPKDDTLPVLAKYARDTDADLKRWYFLTGDKKDIYLLAQNGFKLTAEDDSTAGIPDFIHSTRLVLVDRSGEIRGYYDVQQEDEMKKLKSDVGRLL